MPKFTTIAIDHLRLLYPDEGQNPNRMTPEDFEALKRAITKRGFLQPLLVREYGPGGAHEVIDGHHRFAAVVALNATCPSGWAPLTALPCAIVEYPGDAAGLDAKLTGLGMNRIRGEVDLARAATLMGELEGAGWPLEEMTLAGFNDQEVADLLRIAHSAAEDNPPLPAAMEMPSEEPEPTKPWVLEVEFTDKADYQRVRKTLKRAAGKGADLATGLLNLIGKE